VPTDLAVLCATTAGVALAHTVLGPDHYLPFIAMARAGRWSRAKTVAVTLACGAGHVAGSVLLGMIGVALGISVAKLSAFESLRGSVAAWGLILFGACYAAWGIRRAIRNTPHSHWHAHPDDAAHRHAHVHQADHLHLHERSPAGGPGVWALFAVFLLGPCEPLIPLMMVPAVAGSPGWILLVVAIFASVTLAAMLGAVLLGTAGRVRLPAVPGRRFGHALAGALVCASGVLMEFTGS